MCALRGITDNIGSFGSHFDYHQDPELIAITTFERPDGDPVSNVGSAQRLVGVEFQTFVDTGSGPELLGTATTSVSGMADSSVRDELGTAPVGSTAWVCADPSPEGYTFDELLLNATGSTTYPGTDTSKADWPCVRFTGITDNIGSFGSHFDYHQDPELIAITTFERPDGDPVSNVGSAQRLPGVEFQTFVDTGNGPELLGTATTSVSGMEPASTNV